MADELDLGRLVVAPGRRLCGLAVDLELRRGILRELSDVVYGCGGRELYVAFYAVLSGRGGLHGVVFLDLTGAAVSAEELAERMRGVEGVRDVELLKPAADGLLVDYLHHKLMFSGERAILVRRGVYRALVDAFKGRFACIGEGFLYYAGYEWGAKIAESHAAIAEGLGLRDPLEIMKRLSMSFFSAVGFGRLEVAEASLKPQFRMIVRAHDLFEDDGAPKSKKPCSHLMRGILAGLCSALFKVNGRADEVKCAAMGNPYCEFLVSEEPT
ncbi:MAG: V4R domain-containing protein [Desulfurococcaceae archaeon]